MQELGQKYRRRPIFFEQKRADDETARWFMPTPSTMERTDGI
jgi:hypothetical protein